MERTTEYATAEDFCSLFRRDMALFYQLALLLTADHEPAERIFVTSLKECQTGNPVFKERVHSWAKRVIITSAIRLIAPTPSKTDSLQVDYPSADSPVQRNAAAGAIMRLSPFIRFVFIITVLEKFSDRECAVLLRSTKEEVVQARIRAFQAIALNKVSRPPVESLQPAAVSGKTPSVTRDWDSKLAEVETEAFGISA